jgi:hypothetical protein
VSADDSVSPVSTAPWMAIITGRWPMYGYPTLPLAPSDRFDRDRWTGATFAGLSATHHGPGRWRSSAGRLTAGARPREASRAPREAGQFAAGVPWAPQEGGNRPVDQRPGRQPHGTARPPGGRRPGSAAATLGESAAPRQASTGRGGRPRRPAVLADPQPRMPRSRHERNVTSGYRRIVLPSLPRCKRSVMIPAVWSPVVV